jgi:hypothetical protein
MVGLGITKIFLTKFHVKNLCAETAFVMQFARLDLTYCNSGQKFFSPNTVELGIKNPSFCVDFNNVNLP